MAMKTVQRESKEVATRLTPQKRKTPKNKSAAVRGTEATIVLLLRLSVEGDVRFGAELTIVAELDLVAHAHAGAADAGEHFRAHRQDVGLRGGEAHGIVIDGGFGGVEGEQGGHAAALLFDAQDAAGLLVDPERAAVRGLVERRARLDAPR